MSRYTVLNVHALRWFNIHNYLSRWLYVFKIILKEAASIAAYPNWQLERVGQVCGSHFKTSLMTFTQLVRCNVEVDLSAGFSGGFASQYTVKFRCILQLQSFLNKPIAYLPTCLIRMWFNILNFNNRMILKS